MDTGKYIDSLFSDYQETSELADFKEELKNFLEERVRSLMKGGLGESEAFAKASGELGDITAVADEVSRKKKQEVLGEMYLGTRHYISAKKSALYALCGLVLGAAILIPLITWLASGDAVGASGSVLPFGMVSLLGFLYLGLTQETASREAMSWKRALLYVLAAGLILFGAITAFIVYFAVSSESPETLAEHGADPKNAEMLSAISVLFAFVLPGIGLGIFLFLSEKDRSKPWVIDRRKEHMKHASEQFSDPAKEQQFGLISGAIWILAAAVFVALGFLIGFRYSWLTFLVAVAAELVALALMTGKHKA
jgi:uncharacterized membrane protein YbhN (UPF0104 family)